MRKLSRVFYRRPDRVHVDIAAPVKRRIIADGSALYYHEEGRPLGFSRPIAELDGPFLDSLRNIPATPMEHLRKLKGLPEQELPPSPECPFRRAYQAERRFVVLSCDAQKRLTRLDFFTAPDMAVRTAEYTYEQYAQAGGAWIPCLHKGSLTSPDGSPVTETRHITNLIVNEPIPDRLFDPRMFFKGVDFVNDFEATLASPPETR